MKDIRYIIGLSLAAGLSLAVLLNVASGNSTLMLLRSPLDTLSALVRVVSGTSFQQSVK